MDGFELRNEHIAQVVRHLEDVLHGKRDALIRVLACIFSGGHLLLEDLPGLGKTTLALAVSHALGLGFGRIQCTNDLLPTDVTGLNIFKADRGEFQFHPGPVFNNLLLVDEINRATPKTQSALLEAMGEEQVTVDGTTYALPRPFHVIATQNPIEFSGTFPLPESQMDRFTMRISIGYPSRESEREILQRGSQKQSVADIPAILSPEGVTALQQTVETDIAVSDKVLDYVLSLVERTRTHPLLAAGLSTRGAMVLLNCAKCAAWLQNRDFVIPEDVKCFAPEVMLHRMQPRSGSRGGAPEILRDILLEVPVLQ